MKVYGARKNLDIFKRDMAGKDENTIISFQNVMPEPKDTSEWEEESDFWSGSESWRRLNWHCPYDASWPNLEDKGEYLSYTFNTPYGEPIPIYELLIERYSALNFEIEFHFEVGDDWIELASRGGKLTKKIYMYWGCIPWGDGSKDLLYRKDLLKKTLHIVEERIFGPDEDLYGMRKLVAPENMRVEIEVEYPPETTDDFESDDDNFLEELSNEDSDNRG
jgi:hypothetical protein